VIDNKDKVALIFGVRNDSSIAWAAALALINSGAAVVLCVAAENYNGVVEMIKRLNLNVEVYAADIRKDAEVNEAIVQCVSKYKKIDYLLHAVAFGNHNVMCSEPGKDEVDYLNIQFEDLADSFDISAYSLIRVVRIAKPYLTNGSSILTLTYNASQKVFPSYAGMAINKAALENIVIYLSHFLGKENIRINAISAGMVMTTSAGGIKGVRTLRKIGKEASPLGNITAEDVANTVLYYFSKLSNSVTGNIHYVDGGLNNMGIVYKEKE
jgi:enoyl-[acyl-carrier protein] reductase I